MLLFQGGLFLISLLTLIVILIKKLVVSPAIR
ncbi:putative holin-like toxin [Clostridium baratii]|nr:putative holin-like toxin [Clostridium baratii]